MIKAIVYRSETGHAKKYAELLGERIGLPVYDLDSAVREDAMLQLLLHGGDRVSADELSEVVNWYMQKTE